jgi:ribosomal protein S9/S16
MSDSKGVTPLVSCFGKKKTATAVVQAKEGKGEVRLNGQPIMLIQPETLRWKAIEPILVVGKDKFKYVDF